MSEPTSRATTVNEVIPGILHWSLQDDRIGAETHSYAITSDDGTVLIDPLPLEESALTSLGDVKAICLTGRFHQRAAWRYQQQFGVPVYAPSGAEGLEGTQDHWYSDRDDLPGGLLAVHAPGPAEVHYVFLHEHKRGTVLFIADLLLRPSADDYFRFVPGGFQVNPAQTRKSVQMLIDNFDIEIICPNHGAPVTENGQAALQEALEKDDGR